MPHRHADRLTSFDTSFLVNEKANVHMGIGAVLICDGAAPTREELVAHVHSRLHLLPRLRQRLAEAPLRLGTPFWVDYPEFDVEAHIHSSTLSGEGSVSQLRELAGTVFAPPLDRSKPLWEMWLVAGLEGERFAVIYKTHHALTDGLSAVDIGTLLFDLEPTHEPPPPPGPWSPDPTPATSELATAVGRGLWAALCRTLRWLRAALRDPRRAARSAGDGAAGIGEVARALTKPAPAVPFNVKIGPRRSFAWTTVELEALKQIKRLAGGTVNDVALAVTAGALRRWLTERGVATEGLRLRALVPVSVRADEDHGEVGNQLTAMRGPLPVDIADPLERLRFVSAAMDDLKASKQPLGAKAIWGLNDWFRDFAPPLLLILTAALNFSTRLFNLLVTNFPGPQVPFYVLGRKLTGVFPAGFLAERHALAMAILSYDGQVNFGLLADPDAVGDPEAITAHLAEELALLGAAAATPAG